MDITIDELLQGKATQIKNKNYFPTKQYVEPFLERLEKYTDYFKVSVKLPQQLTLEKTNPDITYNRVLVQAILKNEFNAIDNHEEVVGLLYGLDTRKPIVKMYRGSINCACTNLAIFNPLALRVQDLLPESPIDFKPADEMLNYINDTSLWIKTLQNTYWEREDETIERNLGKWIINSIDNKYNGVSLSPGVAIKAYKLLFDDEESPYFVSKREEVCMFDVYNAFTQTIRDEIDKDLVNFPEKTLLLRQILEF